ncbi:MAG: Flp pilus assembly complex ATPase component TadA, partial [Actinobacteria bacterium]|nr:Flp pilus assembly complex ATPase component TadA [Actinomycetota bacterium]
RRRSTDFDNVDAATLDRQIHDWVDENRPKLGEVLLELGSVDPDELLEALQQQKELPDDAEVRTQLGQILIQLGSIDERALAAALAQQFGVPLVSLVDAPIESDAVARVPEELARRHSILPLRVEGGRVYLATADPLDTEAIRDLTTTCGSIGVMIGPRSQIERLIDETYNVLAAADDVIRAFELVDEPHQRQEAEEEAVVDENAPVVQVVNRILTQGVRSRASDIHIEPGEDHIRVRFRIDGAMSEVIQLPSRMSSALSSRLKVMAGLNIVERRRPQDGQFAVTVDARPIDVRIATAATVHGEKVVLRLLDKTKSLISLRDLGMPASVEGPYMKIVRAPLGMLLCTGPTGSGKTTTLYATLTEINDPSR